MRVVELFAGPGGLSEGLRRAGVSDDQAIGIEIDPAACATAEANGHKRLGPGVRGDVMGVDPTRFGRPGEVEGVCGSPVCTPFSTAGLQLGLGDIGIVRDLIVDMGRGIDRRLDVLFELDDARSLLVVEPLRYVLALRPRWVVLEQVPAVLPLWQTTGEALRQLGYSVWCGIITSEQYGVPQTRRRSVLLAHASRAVAGPVATHSRYYSRDPQRLDEGLPKWVSMAEHLGWPDGRVGFPRLADGGETIAIGGHTLYRARDLRPTAAPAQVLTEKARSWERWTMRSNNQERAAVRLVDEPAPAIMGAHSTGDRRWVLGDQSVPVTVDEAAALQTFPRGWVWHGTRSEQFQQIGNAVPCLMAEAMARAVLD